MNLGEMRARAQYRARDLGNLLTAPNVWNDHLNAAYYEFIEAAPFPFDIAQATIVYPPLTASMPLPEGVFEVLSVLDESDTIELRPLVSWRAVMEVYPDITETGAVRHFRVIGSQLRLFPVPETGVTVLVTYYEQPPALSSDDDLPVLPARYHEAIVSGALVRAFTDDHDMDAIAVYEKEFDKYVALAIGEFSSPTGGRYVPLPRANPPAPLYTRVR